jgi:hypothetical protein
MASARLEFTDEAYGSETYYARLVVSRHQVSNENAIVLDIKEYLGGDIDGETFIFLSKDQVKQLVNFLTEEEENE